MKWTFKLRGESVSLNIIEGVEAVRAGKISEKLDDFKLDARSFAKIKDEQERIRPLLPPQSALFFGRDGWVFLPPETAKLIPKPSRRVLVSDFGNLLLETDLLTVQLAPSIPENRMADFLKEDNLTVLRQLKFAPKTFEARIPSGTKLPDIVSRLQNKPNTYLFAEPELLQVITGRSTPTDPGFPIQWQHSNGGADIHSERAWDRTRGRGVRIAVLDNGMQVNHPDLQPGIIGGGYFDADESGMEYNFVRHSPGATGFPNRPHGTSCLGMAGAKMNNGTGGCGSAPEADLIVVACAFNDISTQTTLARAITYAANPHSEDPSAPPPAGSDIISCSLGPDGDGRWLITSALYLAITYAANEGRGQLGTPIFWAVNNRSRPVSEDEVCSHNGVIAVGKSDDTDHEDGSAFGSKLEFLAPGVGVYTTTSGGTYGNKSGTSFAAPLAAGVGALVLARHSGWTRDQVLQKLRNSCDPVGGVTYVGGRHPDYGYGRINAEKAVS